MAANLRSLAQLGPLPFRSLDVSFNSKGLSASSFVDFDTPVPAAGADSQPLCTGAIDERAVREDVQQRAFSAKRVGVCEREWAWTRKGQGKEKHHSVTDEQRS